MKTRNWMMLAGLALATVLIVAPAMAQNVSLRANIPFSFTANNVPFTEGWCTVHSLGNRSVMLSDTEKNHAIAMLTIDDVRQAQDVKMIFHRYGDQYFLVRIETPDLAYKLPVSRNEIKLARQSSPREVAVLATAIDDAGR